MCIAGDTRVALVDDHRLFRKGMVELVNNFTGYRVDWEADNGLDFTQKISAKDLPDLVLLDISMPIMDGFETAKWLEDHYPSIKILALSMHNDDETVYKMLQSGVNGYVLKNADPAELKAALNALENDGSYFSNRISEIVAKSFNKRREPQVELSEREKEFLKLACTGLPYKSFAPLLKIHPRVVEGTREALFKKICVTSRVELAVYAIKKGIFKIT